jgi:hypothetical protein
MKRERDFFRARGAFSSRISGTDSTNSSTRRKRSSGVSASIARPPANSCLRLRPSPSSIAIHDTPWVCPTS